MRKAYLLKLAMVKKADIDSEVEKAKSLRDNSIWLDLLKHTVKGGLGGGALASLGALGIGAPAGFIANTRPSELTGIPPYVAGPINPTTVGGMPIPLKQLPSNLAEWYDTFGTAGAVEGYGKLAKKWLKPGIGIGAGLGALYSLLTYAHRKAKAEKKLKELGIE